MGMQSSSDDGFCGVVVRGRGGGREEDEGEIKSPQVKKKEETFRAVDFYLFPLSH